MPCFFSIVKDHTISANNLNHDLGIIQQWAYQWKMEFNPDPTKQATEVFFSCKKSSPNHPQLIFNGIAVAKVNYQKHLGLIIDSRLSFEKHLNEKIIKVKKNIGILKHLSKFLPLKTLDQMYKALIRPHLDYCDIIYHIPSHQNQPPLGVTLNSAMEKVERIQYQSALAISGAWPGSSRTKLYEELGWDGMGWDGMGWDGMGWDGMGWDGMGWDGMGWDGMGWDGMELGWDGMGWNWDGNPCQIVVRVDVFYRFIKYLINKTPSYLNEKLLPNCRALFSGNTHNTFHEIICKSNRYMNSFFPDAISSWNIFIKHFDDVPSFDILKKHINTFFRPMTSNISGIHDPVGLRYLFQLRLSLSPLRSHKFRPNFTDTPSEICRCNQGIEDTNHFFLSCPNFVTQRATLTTSVINILQKNNLNYLGNQSKLYIYGHPSIISADNRKLLYSTIKYIKATLRFSS